MPRVELLSDRLNLPSSNISPQTQASVVEALKKGYRLEHVSGVTGTIRPAVLTLDREEYVLRWGSPESEPTRRIFLALLWEIREGKYSEIRRLLNWRAGPVDKTRALTLVTRGAKFVDFLVDTAARAAVLAAVRKTVRQGK
eukprot:RCo038588